MSKLQYVLTIIAISLMVLSCNKQLPQLPSNKGNGVDQNTVSLLAINQNLAKKEAATLKKYVQQTNKAFRKSDIGFWYIIDKPGNGSLIKDSIECKFIDTLMLLNGKVLQIDKKQIIIGKKQVVVGLEEGLKLMKNGASATFIIPWYLGYGMKGYGTLIPPYTSLIYKIKVLN